MHEFERESFALICPDRTEIDWSVADQVSNFLQSERPDLIINSAGWDDSPSDAQQHLLADSSKALARACVDYPVGNILQLSSYRVFGGEQRDLYLVDDRPSPLTASGRCFMDAEQAYGDELLANVVILRFGWLLSPGLGNRFSKYLNALSSGESIQACPQLRGMPTPALDMARVVVAVSKQLLCGAANSGVYQYASAGECSELELAEVLADLLDGFGALRASIEPQAQLPASEPESSLLSGDRLRDDFGIMPRAWRQNLATQVQLWLEQQGLKSLG